MKYEWDPSKARSNERIHQVGFDEAETCFNDPFSMTYYDPDHSDEEEREILVGYSNRGRVLVVCHTYRGEAIRIISARKATPKESGDYHASRI